MRLRSEMKHRVDGMISKELRDECAVANISFHEHDSRIHIDHTVEVDLVTRIRERIEHNDACQRRRCSSKHRAHDCTTDETCTTRDEQTRWLEHERETVLKAERERERES